MYVHGGANSLQEEALRQGKSIEKRRRNKIKGGRRSEEGTFIQRKK